MSNKAIKVIHYYKKDSNKHIRVVYLNLSAIENFYSINYDGPFYWFYNKNNEHLYSENQKVAIISKSGKYYFSDSPIESFFKLQENEPVGNRFEILDL